MSDSIAKHIGVATGEGLSTRRGMLTGTVGLATGAAIAGCARALPTAAVTSQMAAKPITNFTVDIPGGSIYLRECNGGGEPILLAHPVTGSAHVWDRQLTELASAGYRALAWSRRGHLGSSPEPDAGSDMVADMLALIDALGLDHFHALGSAAGSGVVLGFAAKHAVRLRSLTLVCSALMVVDPPTRELSRQLMPPQFSALPAHLRELGPEYRAANPQGVRQWLEMEEHSRHGDRTKLPPIPPVSLETLRGFAMPVLWIAGGADMFAPPSMLRPLAAHIPGARFAVIDNAGHSAYWEYPEEFARLVLDFLATAKRG